MKKILLLMMAMMVLGSTNANAQGFLKKLKQKAENAVGKAVIGKSAEEAEKEAQKYQEEAMAQYGIDADEKEKDNTPVVPKTTDLIPKKSQSTLIWDGVVTPSKASSAQALLAELPPLPSAEKIAKSTTEERNAYYSKIQAVTLRVDILQKSQSEGGCSDADIEAERIKWEKKLQNLFGLTAEEMAILQSDNASDAQREAVTEKMLQNKMGLNMNDPEMAKFEKMSEKEQENYIMKHPEFIQKMQKIATKARTFSNEAQQLTAGVTTMEEKVAKLNKDRLAFEERELNHNYDMVKAKYNDRLQKIYNQIFATNDQAQIDALYEQADALLLEYRIKAATEYRASLQRRINKEKEYVAEWNKIMQEAVADGTIPECTLNRSDLNLVTNVANDLNEAYKDLPELDASPVQKETVFTLPNGYNFGWWESFWYIGDVSKMVGNGGKNVGSVMPLLAFNDKDGTYGKVVNGKFQKISEKELDEINQKNSKAGNKRWAQGAKPPYGTYKSRSGKRTVEYNEGSGDIVISGMTYFFPISFTASADKLQWVEMKDNKLLLCTYKL